VTSATAVDGVKSTVVGPDFAVTWIVLPETESIRPITQSWPLPDADGVDEEGALLLGVAGAGLVSLEFPHAARDSAVALVTASSATRDSRVVDRVGGIAVLSMVGRDAQADSGNGFHPRCRR
jgi:hypothetical protein